MGPGLRRDKRLLRPCLLHSDGSCEMKTETFHNILLLVAFRHSITGPNIEAGFERIQAIAGRKLGPSAFHDALACCLREGLMYEPVRLPEGSLQCHWHLELTPKGVEAVRGLLRERSMTADQLFGQLMRQIDAGPGG